MGRSLANRGQRVAFALLALVAVLFASVALAGVTPTFTIDNPTAEAGKPVTFTVTRVSGDRGGYVLFRTADGTAKAGVDYQATERLVYVRAGADVITVPVPTFANPAASGPLTFTAAIASTNVGLAGTATITQPPPPPPPPQWVPAPLVEGGYARVKVTTLGWPKGQNPTANQYNYIDVYRQAQAGEILQIYPNGWGYSWDNRVTYSLHGLTDPRDIVILYASDLEGVARAQ